MPGRLSKIAARLGVPANRLNALSARWRMRFPHEGYREHHRVPLWHENAPFVLITSQRAGSTLGTAWFLHHAGLLDRAKDYDPFVHRYEQDILFRRTGYLDGLEQALRDKPVYKLMRDPGERAFASYLQLHNAEVADDPRDHRRAVRERIVQEMGLGSTYDTPLPFADFLRFLAQADHRYLEGHEARQANLYEKNLPRGLPAVLRLEEFGPDIRRVEESLGLPLSSNSEIEGFGHAGHRVPKREDAEGFRRMMNEGAGLPWHGTAPMVTTATIEAYPEAKALLRQAFGPDYELLRTQTNKVAGNSR
ncbi:hypothetical protein [Parvularcula maris]|uniref:Sulfotransferase family protein n=1 Tax=Parvularcula maris TaxID=2965077 RepID=A0A9X2L6M2_9PROT|nr:hypothetical protein [Parvularcula maris]MCQ8184011.1 hypothetical protein [Parvularcula maris]